MTCENIHDFANKFLDKDITEQELAELEVHLEFCRNCNRTFGSYKKLSFELNNIESVITPPASILEQLIVDLQSTGISETSIDDRKKGETEEKKSRPVDKKPEKKDKIKPEELLFSSKQEIFWKRHKLKILIAILAFLFCAVATIYFILFYSKSTSPWQIIGYSGKYYFSEQKNSANNLYLNQKLITDVNSHVIIAIPKLGKINLGPLSEIQLVNDKENESGISLYKGKVEVSTFTQNKHFSVETMNAKFTENLTNFSVEQKNTGITHIEVTSGLLLIQSSKEFFTLSAKYSCDIITKKSYNIPFRVDGNPQFISALKELDSGNNTSEIIAQIAANAKESDAITLWHLLKRVSKNYRILIFNKLNEFFPIPQKVTKDGIIALDNKMLQIWQDDIISRL